MNGSFSQKYGRRSFKDVAYEKYKGYLKRNKSTYNYSIQFAGNFLGGINIFHNSLNLRLCNLWFFRRSTTHRRVSNIFFKGIVSCLILLSSVEFIKGADKYTTTK